MYMPELGRFTARDPMPEDGQILFTNLPPGIRTRAPHPYSYVDNNPINMIDPSGKEIMDWSDPPTPPKFPEAGKVGTSFKNARTLFGTNCSWFCSPSRKDSRLKPIPNLGPL